ncbi:MAG: hypothetical protein ACO1SX_20180 [Actinomycetota bacterium]
MRKSAITALAVAAGAGIAYFLGSKRGQDLIQQAGQAIRELPGLRNQPDTANLVEKALQEPHPETAMAHAFEEASSM